MSASRKDDRQKQELLAIISDIPGNERCADCEAYSPDWASYSLGVFLCARCAAIHRKNSDVSKVKSITLDNWTPDQVQKMREIGNTISNYKYNPLREWPIQDDDSTMERFIKDKYERQKFMSQRETANFTPVKSAMKGSAKLVEPSKSSSSVIKYSKELDTLREMGFTDRVRNVDVLKSVMGDVSQATDVLVLEATTSSSKPSKIEKPRVRFTADTIGGEDQVPQMQAANPFAQWSGQSQGGPSAPQQDFSNPFSSIPPSMYHNQNFVQNVHDQTQQSAPFMGYQTTGQDTMQSQYAQPAVPLRTQLTGGQPLRPQMTAPAMQDQQQMQPLRHQLTGRPMTAPPQQQLSQQQQQQQLQQPQVQAQQAFPSQYQQPQQGNFQQEQQSQPQSYQSQAYQTSLSGTSSPNIPNFFTTQGAPQGTNSSTRPPPPPTPLKAQLTGNMRPKFQPTVDLNAPFSFANSQGQHNFRTQSPLISSQQQSNATQFQNQPPQVTGQYNTNLQASSLYQPDRNQTQTQTLQPTSTNFGSRISPQQSGIMKPGNDIFGQSFTSPLRAELTGIQQQMTGGAFPPSQYGPQEANNFTTQSQQTQGNASNLFPTTRPQQPNPTGFNQFGQNSGQYSQAVYPQPTGSMPPQATGLFPQNTGGQGFSTTPQSQATQNTSQFQPPFSPQQTGPIQNNYQQSMPQNGYQQQQQSNFQIAAQQLPQQQMQYGQPQVQHFQPQSMGVQRQSTGLGLPSKPFDKASIMSLYGSQQSQPQHQQQPQYMQQQQQQYNINGYGQQGYSQQQQQQQQPPPQGYAYGRY